MCNKYYDDMIYISGMLCAMRRCLPVQWTQQERHPRVLTWEASLVCETLHYSSTQCRRSGSRFSHTDDIGCISGTKTIYCNTQGNMKPNYSIYLQCYLSTQVTSSRGSSQYTVELTGCMSRCMCIDWLETELPCKHMFHCLRVQQMSWSDLPEVFRYVWYEHNT